jgi:hypothetical protein
MDPVSAAILAAVAAGLLKGAGETASGAVLDAYEGLKSVLRRCFGGDSSVTKAVDDLEANPGSMGRQDVVREEVEAVGAHRDPQVLAAAQLLLERLRDLPGGEAHIQLAMGNYIAQADRGGHAEVRVGTRERPDETPRPA